MKIFIAFLLVCFLAGGFRLGRIPQSRPMVFGLCCIVVGAAFLSLRAIQ